MRVYLFSILDFDQQSREQLRQHPRVLKLDTLGHIIMRSCEMSEEEFETRLLHPVPEYCCEFAIPEASPELIWARLLQL